MRFSEISTPRWASLADASSIYYALGLVAAQALGLTPVVFVEVSYHSVAGCRVRCRLIRTRNPGRAIVEEAIERRSDLIYISTEHAPSEERLLGPTTRYVLAHRPCRVVVEHDPTSHPAPHDGDGKVPSGVVTPPKALDPR